jgi:hypothetical protein
MHAQRVASAGGARRAGPDRRAPCPTAYA